LAWALFSSVRSMSFHPWCLINASLLDENLEPSFSTALSDSSPRYLVIDGNFSVSLYVLYLAAWGTDNKPNNSIRPHSSFRNQPSSITCRYHIVQKVWKSPDAYWKKHAVYWRETRTRKTHKN